MSSNTLVNSSDKMVGDNSTAHNFQDYMSKLSTKMVKKSSKTNPSPYPLSPRTKDAYHFFFKWPQIEGLILDQVLTRQLLATLPAHGHKAWFGDRGWMTSMVASPKF